MTVATASGAPERAGGEPAGGEVLLGHVLDTLGPGVVTASLMPAGREVPVAEPVIFERGQGLAAGDVVLAVGVDAAGSEALTLVDAAAAARASAVAFKLEGGAWPAALADAAARQGVALLGVPAAAMWGQLFTLLRAACSLERTTSGAPGSDVPLGDLFSVANAVAAIVGGAVTIEDPSSRVLAFSSLDHPIDGPRQATILGQRIPGEWAERLRRDGVFRRLYREGGVVRVAPDEVSGLRGRMATAVAVGGEVLGSIWVVEGDAPFDGRAESALLEAARAAAPHLVRHRTAVDVERERRRQVVSALLDGAHPTDETVALLGAPGASAWSVVALAATGGAAPGTHERLVDLIALFSEALRRQATAVSTGPTVYVVVPAAERVVELAGDVVDQAARSLRVEVVAGVGGAVDALADVWRSRRGADQALRVLRQPGSRRRVAHVDSVRAGVVLAELRDLARRDPTLLAGPLDLLADHDRRSGTGYVQTLRAWLDAFGDVTAASAAIHVHPNTFRYRMRRLAQIAGLDLDDPDQRLVLNLQLRLGEPDQRA